MSRRVQVLIQFLQSNNFMVECPNCNGIMVLSEMELFDAENFIQETKELLKKRKQFIMVANPAIFSPECKSPKQIVLANPFCEFLKRTT